ncbi:hypothetical protein HN51_028466, partial [Arachis hypogaea]
MISSLTATAIRWSSSSTGSDDEICTFVVVLLRCASKSPSFPVYCLVAVTRTPLSAYDATLCSTLFTWIGLYSSCHSYCSRTCYSCSSSAFKVKWNQMHNDWETKGENIEEDGVWSSCSSIYLCGSPSSDGCYCHGLALEHTLQRWLSLGSYQQKSHIQFSGVPPDAFSETGQLWGSYLAILTTIPHDYVIFVPLLFTTFDDS